MMCYQNVTRQNYLCLILASDASVTISNGNAFRVRPHFPLLPQMAMMPGRHHKHVLYLEPAEGLCSNRAVTGGSRAAFSPPQQQNGSLAQLPKE